MWIFDKRGFFALAASQTPKAPKGTLSVRARVRADLDAFRKHYSSKLGPTIVIPGADYEYRADISPDELRKAMVKMAEGVDYTKFKPEAERFSTGGHERHSLYLGVWSAMLNAERRLMGWRKSAKRLKAMEAEDFPTDGRPYGSTRPGIR